MEFPSREEIVSRSAGYQMQEVHRVLAFCIWNNFEKEDTSERDSIMAHKIMRKDYIKFGAESMDDWIKKGRGKGPLDLAFRLVPSRPLFPLQGQIDSGEYGNMFRLIHEKLGYELWEASGRQTTSEESGISAYELIEEDYERVNKTDNLSPAGWISHRFACSELDRRRAETWSDARRAEHTAYQIIHDNPQQ